jgi:hypothetical protein
VKVGDAEVCSSALFWRKVDRTTVRLPPKLESTRSVSYALE